VFRELAVKSGERLSSKDLEKKIRLSKEQLMNTSLFVKVEVEENYAPGGIIDITFFVFERWYFFPIPYFKVVDRNWNVWINTYKASLDRTQYGIKLAHNNFSGFNDKLNVWLIAGYTQQMEMKYFLPYLDRKLEKGVVAGFSFGQNRELNYSTDSNRQVFRSLPNFGRKYYAVEADFSYRKGSRLRTYAKFIYGYEGIDSAFFKLNPNYLGGVTEQDYLDFIATFQYFNVDFIPFPLRGWYVDFSLQKRFSETLNQLRLSGKMLATWKFMPKTYINFQSAFSMAGPRHQPFVNQRLMGYRDLWMQGYELYVMDGTIGAMGRTTLRRELFTYVLRGPDKWKTYSRIPFRVFAKTYGNIGYAHHPDPGTNFLNNRLLRSAGFGFDISTIYDVVFKIDYSFNQLGEHGFFFHTSADF
jgi:hypothetical protein